MSYEDKDQCSTRENNGGVEVEVVGGWGDEEVSGSGLKDEE